MNFEKSAARYDAWYRTPLGALAHALESEAVFGLAGPKTFLSADSLSDLLKTPPPKGFKLNPLFSIDLTFKDGN